ncbi:hypothetical protein GCG54_00001943 [Colletotrichum gloeosporioides]|uniref:Uncharacterized protein n=1 Tax=Colletotrichum gloeosporioides TaxID=474922 RepID=A0A8H4CWU7_COLGL|nr:uncharacterized protein GCG54_00001943 [Colletotrichum gloeosporioides]KAF3811614.1 hypothetical protein GCG54_00001943 [Colletotrichum gloeosporioides]
MSKLFWCGGRERHSSFLSYCNTTKPHDHPSSASSQTFSFRHNGLSASANDTRGITKNMKP